jgi:hypothetical protein
LRKLFFASGIAAVLVTGLTTSPRAQAGEIDLLAKWMTGTFSSAQQAEADTNFFDIRLEMVRIWRDRTDGYWIYVEQASAKSLSRPYRQRVYHVTGPVDSVYMSDVYTIPDPMDYAGQGRDPDALSDLKPADLTMRDGCTVYLRRQPDGSFKGGTRGNDCESTLRGASYATSEVMVTYDRIVSWDRGFDEKGGQAWGATTGGYVFIRTRYN